MYGRKVNCLRSEETWKGACFFRHKTKVRIFVSYVLFWLALLSFWYRFRMTFFIFPFWSCSVTEVNPFLGVRKGWTNLREKIQKMFLGPGKKESMKKETQNNLILILYGVRYSREKLWQLSRFCYTLQKQRTILKPWLPLISDLAYLKRMLYRFYHLPSRT